MTLGLLSAFAVLASEVPWVASLPLAAISMGCGVVLARRELLRPTLELVISRSGTATIDGIAVEQLQVDWRGTLAFLQWRDADGRWQRRQGWPDNVGAVARRELRLAMAARAPAHSPRSVAP